MNRIAAEAQLPDLSTCDREPIHIPGSIQPQGVLLALDPADFRIVHASANLDRVLGRAPEAVFGMPLAEAVPGGEALAPVLAGASGPDAALPRLVWLPTPAGQRPFDAVAHRFAGRLIVELEESGGDPGLAGALYLTLRQFTDQAQAAGTVETLCALAVDELRRLTGFDRVLAYRFDADWHGTVVAESRNDVLPSYLGLRFPASDIPTQARELYRRNRVRIIPDARYEPVPILPPRDPGTGAPLDLSHALLRSVSPVHLEYMENMGTMASMSVSIIQEGRLWGMLSCHNQAPRRVPVAVRSVCDFLAQILAVQIGWRERSTEAEHRIRLGTIQTGLLAAMAEEESFADGLVRRPDLLLRLADASGAAVIAGDGCHLLGATPPEAEVRRIVAWLVAQRPGEIFATAELPAELPEAGACADTASGLLAISISKLHASYLLWFRPETVQTVRWGGDPAKPVVEPEGMSMRLHPRASFEVWKETVRQTALPWRPAELDAAKELRTAILGIVLRRAEEMAALTDELRRSNRELEAFSYSVSHDLRAPFRHIVGYAELLRTHEGERLTDRGRRYVATIIESAFTAGTLVDSLLSYSLMGRTALHRIALDMNALVQEVLRTMARDVAERRIEWRVEELGTVNADPTMFRLVVENLVSNAVKYTRGRDPAVIGIGCASTGEEHIYSVRDNGVGFDMAYAGKLFGVFQRLHRMEEYEGTGIGLANVRRIVERHGGRTWAEGALDQGATFYFALPRETPTGGSEGDADG